MILFGWYVLNRLTLLLNLPKIQHKLVIWWNTKGSRVWLKRVTILTYFYRWNVSAILQISLNKP